MFTIELDLPSGRKVRIPELNNRDYLTILKFCENKDYYGLSECFNELFIPADLNIFDRFFILIYVRKLFVGSKLTFKGKDDMDISYSLDDALSKLVDNYIDVDRDLVCGDITLTVGVPIGLYFDSIDDLYQYTIRTVSFKGNVINFSDLTSQEKRVLLGKLPTSIFLQLQEYIVELSDTLFDLTLIEANSDLEVSEVSINILGNGIIYFLSSIFSYDLLYFYEALYHYNHFVSKAGDFFDITYNEARLLLKLHHERIEKENEESKRQGQQNS